jgi:hypothetical protein
LQLPSNQADGAYNTRKSTASGRNELQKITKPGVLITTLGRLLLSLHPAVPHRDQQKLREEEELLSNQYQKLV